MIRTKVTQTSALAGFAPAGKPGYANRQGWACHTRNSMEALGRIVAVAILSVSVFWTAYGQTQGAAAQSQAAPVFSVLYAFTGGTDGFPGGSGNPLILDRLGNLYGATISGGDLSCGNGGGCGVVFKVDPTGTETVLYSFTGAADGGNPYGGVLRDHAGNLYGTTTFGGSSGGAGTVFKLQPGGKETVLYGFSGGADGSVPYAGVVRDEAGNLYGTTAGGGAVGAGVVFKVDPAGHETVLHSFAGGPTDGSSPNFTLLRDRRGNLYGTTSSGGTSTSGSACFGEGCGVVFKLDPSGKETVLYNFTGGADGALPTSGLSLDRAGNLYGTTAAGGNSSSGAPGCSFSFFAPGCGVLFKLDRTGKETVLYAFTGGTDGALPYGGVVRDAAGNLYGTTTNGGDLTGPSGSFGEGVVYEVDPAGKETVLYAFTGLADGGNPTTGLVSNAGNPDCGRYELYGTTVSGGDLGSSVCPGTGCGVVFRLTLPRASEPDSN